MDVHDEYVHDETFSEFVQCMPQCCVEVVVSTDDGVILAKRANAPVKGEWFWPGSRLYKGERLHEAARRVAREELGLNVELVEQLGVHEHFWETSAESGGPSRHTVNVVFLVEPSSRDFSVDLDDQHIDVQFVEAVGESYHEYVRKYFEKHDLPPNRSASV